jgi:hypothetical protein
LDCDAAAQALTLDPVEGIRANRLGGSLPEPGR